uniref:Reverse transcriptase domain-containing protein n=1 Tax=Tanacetum cinerariifolium TaxID=118510 RepID=A0A699GGU1_TANCI|nr:reverse transcriptase domain-containing protein [Tanacetum cinerariifolium]
MLLLLVQDKLSNLNLEEWYALNVALRMFTRYIVIQECMDDLKLGVKSYQKKNNLKRPNTYRLDLRRMTPYTVQNQRDLPRDIPLDSVEVLSDEVLKLKNFKKDASLKLSSYQIKNALGFQNPFYLKKAQQIRLMLYDDSVIAKETNVILIVDSEDALMLEEESQSKMLLKQSDPMVLENKFNIKPINYAVLNQLYEDFGKRFVPQTELSAKQAFWLKSSSSSKERNTSSTPVKTNRQKNFQNIKNDLRKLKGKDIVDNDAQVSNATTIAPRIYKLDPVTLAPKDKNNREAHIYYLKHTMEQAAILRELVEQAKSLNHLDSASYSACKYVKLIQELLGYVRDTCPNIHKPSEKLVTVTPFNKKKTVRFVEPVISLSTSQKQLGSSQTQAKRTMPRWDYDSGKLCAASDIFVRLDCFHLGNLFPPLDNPELTIRRRSFSDPTLLNNFEMDAEGPGNLPIPNLRTIEELCQPSLNGRGGPIAPIAIQATNFRLNNDMIQQVQNYCQFHGLSGDDANKHLDKFLHVTQSIKVNGVTDDALPMAKMFLGKYFPPSMVTKLKNEIANFRQRPDESLFEAWECYKLSINRCPNHNMLPVTQIDTFYNGLTLRHRDTINVAAGETFMKRHPEECYDLIENMTAHYNDWDTSAQRSESLML